MQVSQMKNLCLSEPLVDNCHWWAEYVKKYPSLSIITYQYLSAPPTSVPSESLFLEQAICTIINETIYIQNVQKAFSLLKQTSLNK